MPYKDPEKAREYKRKVYHKRKALLGLSRLARYQPDAAKNNDAHKLWCKTEAGIRSLRNTHLRRRYGMTIESFEELLTKQGSTCALCSLPFSETDKILDDPAVDHDHKCCPGDKSCGKCIRGIIHRGCNSGLGYFKDSPHFLRMAAEYLERAA